MRVGAAMLASDLRAWRRPMAKEGRGERGMPTRGGPTACGRGLTGQTRLWRMLDRLPMRRARCGRSASGARGRRPTSCLWASVGVASAVGRGSSGRGPVGKNPASETAAGGALASEIAAGGAPASSTAAGGLRRARRPWGCKRGRGAHDVEERNRTNRNIIFA